MAGGAKQSKNRRDFPLYGFVRYRYGMGIKVVQVNSSDLMGRRFNGYDLHPYLAEQGVDSKQLVYWNKLSDADFVSKAFDYPGNRFITRGFMRVEQKYSMHARLQPHSWSLPYHKVVRQADIAHLHIIHDGYFSLSALPFLAKRKPTVWTWHDPWSMTGHCVYPMECTRWEQGCGSCPDLTSTFSMRTDKTAEQFAWKKKIYAKAKVDVVVASSWMREMVSKSPLSEGLNITTIPFGLNLDLYKDADKAAARARLGVLPGRPVIFIRSYSGRNKGLAEFIKALERLRPDLKLCIISLQEVGHFDHFIGKHQILEFGWSNDENFLLDAYAACDFFAMPSMAEAFGLMAIEAMACGRPVLCFEGSSLPSVSFAPKAGVSVPRGNITALANAIDHLASNLAECEQRGALSRKLAEQHYDIRDQARLTADLYKKVLVEQKK